MCGGSVYRAGMSSGLATGEQNERKVNSLQCFCKKNKRKKKQAKCVVGVSVFMVIAFPDIQPPMAEVMRAFLKRQQ